MVEGDFRTRVLIKSLSIINDGVALPHGVSEAD